jgi:hypothetical protein
LARGHGAKRFVDIERALRWAYCEELPKQRHGGAVRDASPMFRGAAGDDDDDARRSRQPLLPAALGPPHPDALLIEHEVKCLGQRKGHDFGPEDPAGLMWGMDYWSVDLGGPIDLRQAATESVANMTGIVTVHARASTRPRWSRVLPKPRADTGANGKPKVLIDETFVAIYEKRKYKDRLQHVRASDIAPEDWPESPVTHIAPVPSRPIRKGLYRTGTYCPLIYEPDPAGVVAARAEYAAWRVALDILYEALAGRLTSIALIPAAAPWRPWAGEVDLEKPPELFKSLREEPYRRGPRTREEAARQRQAAKRRIERDLRAEETRPTRPSSPRDRREDGTSGA